MPAKEEESADDKVSLVLRAGGGGGGRVDPMRSLRPDGLKVKSLAGTFKGDRILRTGAREVAMRVRVVDVEDSCPYIDEGILAEAVISMARGVRDSSSEVVLAMGAAYRLESDNCRGFGCQMREYLDGFDPRELASCLTYISSKVSPLIFVNRGSQG